MALNTIGGLINYIVYSADITLHSMSMSAPAIGVAAGSLAGLIVDVLVSKRYAFIQAPGAPEKGGEAPH